MDAIDRYREMQTNGIAPDGHTIVGVLKATSQIGDVKTANDALTHLRAHELPMNEYIYNGLIRTYAGACKIKGVKEEDIDVYLDDIWRLLE